MVSHYLFIIYYNIRSVFCQAFHVCYLLNFIYFFILFSINIFPIGRRIPRYFFFIHINILQIAVRIPRETPRYFFFIHINILQIGRLIPAFLYYLFIYINISAIGRRIARYIFFIYIKNSAIAVRIPANKLLLPLYLY